MKEEIQDLLDFAKEENPNVSLLIEDAFQRGLVAGKDLAKKRIIEAIEQEK